MPKLIYQGDTLVTAIFEGNDINRVIAAFQYTLGEMGREQEVAGLPWPDRPEYERILRDLTTPAPTNERPA